MIYKDPVHVSQGLPPLPNGGVWVRRGDYWWAEPFSEIPPCGLLRYMERDAVQPVDRCLNELNRVAIAAEVRNRPVQERPDPHPHCPLCGGY